MNDMEYLAPHVTYVQEPYPRLLKFLYLFLISNNTFCYTQVIEHGPFDLMKNEYVVVYVYLDQS